MSQTIVGIEGYYSISFSGVAGWGTGMLTFDTGMIVGSDIVGGKYDGNYVYNPRTDALDIDVKVNMPAGAWSVTGIPAQSADYEFDIRTSLPRDFYVAHSVAIQTPSGLVNVVFRKLRDFPT